MSLGILVVLRKDRNTFHHLRSIVCIEMFTVDSEQFLSYAVAQ